MFYIFKAFFKKYVYMQPSSCVTRKASPAFGVKHLLIAVLRRRKDTACGPRPPSGSPPVMAAAWAWSSAAGVSLRGGGLCFGAWCSRGLRRGSEGEIGQGPRWMWRRASQVPFTEGLAV